MANLTNKMKLFAEEYIRSYGNATKSAIKAGYSEKTAHQKGYQLKNDLAVQEYIKEIRDSAGVGDPSMVFLEVFDAMQRILHMGDRDSDRIGAGKVINEMFGFKKENINLTGNVGLDFNQLTDEELEEQLARYEGDEDEEKEAD